MGCSQHYKLLPLHCIFSSTLSAICIVHLLYKKTVIYNSWETSLTLIVNRWECFNLRESSSCWADSSLWGSNETVGSVWHRWDLLWFKWKQSGRRRWRSSFCQPWWEIRSLFHLLSPPSASLLYLSSGPRHVFVSFSTVTFSPARAGICSHFIHKKRHIFHYLSLMDKT